MKPNRRRGKRYSEFVGLLKAGFPQTLNELLEQVGEAAGIAEVAAFSRTKRRPKTVDVYATVRPKRRLAHFIVSLPIRYAFLIGTVRWFAPKHEKGPHNPLYPLWFEYQLLRKSPHEALAEPRTVPREPPDITSLLLSHAESKPMPHQLSKPTLVELPKVDWMERLKPKQVGLLRSG